MKERLVILWYWHHFCLEMQEVESINDGVKKSSALFDAEAGLPDSLEEWYEGGYRLVGEDQLNALMIVQDQMEAKKPKPKYRPIVARVYVQHHAGSNKSSDYEIFYEYDKALRRYQELKPFLGERVRLERIET